MRKFSLVSQGGLENLINSRCDCCVALGHLAEVQERCPEITQIKRRVLALSYLHEPRVNEREAAFERF
jgi:hypothetical protein